MIRIRQSSILTVSKDTPIDDGVFAFEPRDHLPRGFFLGYAVKYKTGPKSYSVVWSSIGVDSPMRFLYPAQALISRGR